MTLFIYRTWLVRLAVSASVCCASLTIVSDVLADEQALSRALLEAVQGARGLGETSKGGTTTPPVNEGPIALDDSASTPYETSVVVNVLSNDSDPDGDSLTIVGYTEPENGTLTLNADATFTYTPNGGFSGTDTFMYTISDGNGGEASALVTIEVDAPPPDPEAEAKAFFEAEMHPLVYPTCYLSCHQSGGLAGGSDLVLSGPGSNQIAANYTAFKNFITIFGSSSQLLTKISGGGHPGGVVYSTGSSGYQTIKTWTEFYD